MIYKLQLSNKETMLIDQIEYQKVKDNISANFIELKNGIINPSFVVSITKDFEASMQESKSLKNRETMKMVNAPKTLSSDQIKNMRPDFMKEVNNH